MNEYVWQKEQNVLAPDWLERPRDVNALDANIWTRTTVRDERGMMHIGGVSVEELVQQYGTPLYVFDREDIFARAQHIRQVFEQACAQHGVKSTIYYASKAFLSIEFAQWMSESGLYIDVCTAGELAFVRAAGIALERVGFHGNNKSFQEIEQAVQLGVGTIIIDNHEEAAYIAECARSYGVHQKVRLRIKNGVHAHTHSFLTTAHEDQKFGIDHDDIMQEVAFLRSSKFLVFEGLHCHIGSQIFGDEGFIESAKRCIEIHSELLKGGDVAQLNLGGGFGIAYTNADQAEEIGNIASCVVEAVVEHCQKLGIPVPHLVFEPGRYIAGPAGITLYTVGVLKDVIVSVDDDQKKAVRRYVSIDGGMSDNARPALYGADYTATLASRFGNTDPVLVRVTGKHCETGDVVVDAGYLPSDVRRSDILAVAATGAYCHTLASNYNVVARPPVVSVYQGETQVLIHGETLEDLLCRDAKYQKPVS